jgi:hypothetical protein
LTAPAAAYYLRGDQCPRCLTQMEPVERFRDTSVAAVKESHTVTAQRGAA